MAFGFLGSFVNIPLLNQVRRGWGPLGVFNPWLGSHPLCPQGWAIPGWDPSPCAPQGGQSRPHGWDCTGNVTLVSPELDFPTNPGLSLSQLLQKMGDSGSMV